MSIVSSTWRGGNDAAEQLRDLERQGGGMARLANICAGLLLVAFSAGSLISISAAAFFRFLAAWNTGQADIPDAISLVVNVLLVLAADVALLYAASVLRVLVTSGAPRAEQSVHRWAMIGACVLESSTYLYLVWTFDRPTTLFLWAIGIGRALAAPLCAAYLSMARPLPVSPRDVAYQAALASGKGVVRDVTVLAADPTAPLERKVRIYSASALMSSADRVRFDGIIEAVSADVPAGVPALPDPPPSPEGLPDPSHGLPDEGENEDGGNTWRGETMYIPSLHMVPTGAASSHTPHRKMSAEEARRVRAFALLDADPTMSKAELKEHLRTRWDTASALYNMWQRKQKRVATQ